MRKIKAKIWAVQGGRDRPRSDYLAEEEPLEIRLSTPQKTIAVTMRTPGDDFDLAAGFLYSEGVIRDRADLRQMSHCVSTEVERDRRENIINATLHSELTPNLQPLERHFFTSSACGVCGKASLEALELRGCSPLPPGLQIPAEVIYRLPDKLRAAQGGFAATGGLHAAALFNSQGGLLRLREDVGRHNALDKLIGASFLAGELPWRDRVVMVSGRSSFEILQKCIVAGSPIVCAVSAPSSLAVSLAQAFGITLIGFLRGDRFNLYTGKERIRFIEH